MIRGKESKHLFFVHRINTIELIELEDKQFKCMKQLLEIREGERIDNVNIKINKKQNKIGLIVEGAAKVSIYIFGLSNKDYSLFEIVKNGEETITDIFWLGDRLIALDTSLNFYDLTHNQQLVTL